MPFFTSSKSNPRLVAANAQNGSIRAKTSPLVKKAEDVEKHSYEQQQSQAQAATEKDSGLTVAPCTNAEEHVCDNCLQELDRELTVSPRIRTLDIKSVREFEYERQRAKRIAEREQRSRGRGVNARCNCCSAGNRARQRASPMRSKRGGGATGAVAVAATLDRERWSSLSSIGIGIGFGSDDDNNDDLLATTKGHERRSSLQVTLGDLIRVGKVRKSKAGDFEIIPPVRSVVVLDDFDFTPGAPSFGFVSKVDDDDEAWEHVSASDDDEAVKVPSYAQIASSGAK